MSKVVLITGASSGMGRAAAILLASEGHKVYAGARRMDRMADLAEYGITAVEMDVTKTGDNERVVGRIIENEGRIDVLINNAGFGLYGPVEDALEGWSDSLRLETAPFNIQVVLIEPGAIKTEFGGMIGPQLKKYLGHSAYQAQLDAFIEMIDNPRGVDRRTEAEVVAKVYAKAATTSRPRRRYVTGARARPWMFTRKWLGDGAYEFVLRRAFR